jgi:hypothetical protein
MKQLHNNKTGPMPDNSHTLQPVLPGVLGGRHGTAAGSHAHNRLPPVSSPNELRTSEVGIEPIVVSNEHRTTSEVQMEDETALKLMEKGGGTWVRGGSGGSGVEEPRFQGKPWLVGSKLISKGFEAGDKLVQLTSVVVSQLLDTDPDLQQHKATFVQAEIEDVHLAAKLSTDELKSLLPDEIVLGQVLKLQNLFARASSGEGVAAGKTEQSPTITFPVLFKLMVKQIVEAEDSRLFSEDSVKVRLVSD